MYIWSVIICSFSDLNFFHWLCLDLLSYFFPNFCGVFSHMGSVCHQGFLPESLTTWLCLLKKGQKAFSQKTLKANFSHALFFLIWIEGPRTEGTVCCTECKALWDTSVILGYTDKTDWTTFLYRTVTLTFLFILLLDVSVLFKNNHLEMKAWVVMVQWIRRMPLGSTPDCDTSTNK